MNLKIISSKVIATLVAIYLVIGNCAVAGLGIAEIIAEDIQTPQVAVEQNIEKYVQYNKEYYRGAEIKTSICVKEQSPKERHLPVNSMKVQIQVPAISGILPERVNIVKSNTMLTNGTENYSVNQNYNKDTGLLIVSYENQNKYSEYKENAKDEFEIIYIYPENAYAENSEQREITQKVDIEVGYKVYNKLLYSRASKMNSATMSAEECKNEDIAGYAIKNSSDVFKGYMYSNEENKTNYATDYKTVSELNIVNSGIVDNVEILLEKAIFNVNDNKELNTSSIQYKYTKISEEEFNKIFGQDGVLEFYLGDTKYAAIKYSQADNNGKRNFVTEYYTQEKQNIEAGKVEYPTGTVNVKIESTKPLNEGKIYFENLKQIVPESNYGTKVAEIKSIKESVSMMANKKVKENNEDKIVKVVSNKNNVNILLQEPSTQVALELSNSKLSTLMTNKLTATVKLNDTNSSCKLVNGGNVELKLPDNIKNVKVTNAKSLYENGISIKKAKIESGKVILDIVGKQTTYDTLNISGGVNIVLDLEIDIADTVATHKETITAKYNNVIASQELEIVSKSGILMETLIKNETKNTDEIQVVNNDKIIMLQLNDESQIENMKLNVVNNYDEDLTNVQIIGTLNYTDNTFKNTYMTELIEEVKASKGKIEYSINGVDWKNNYSSDIKYFRITPDEGKLKAKESIALQLKIRIPKNLNYNAESYVKYTMLYTKNNSNNSLNSLIGFNTEKLSQEVQPVSNSKVSVELTRLVGDTVIGENDTINAGQIVKYKFKIKNEYGQDKNNLQLRIYANNANFYEKQATGGFLYGDSYSYVIAEDNMPRLINDISIKAKGVYEGEVLLYIKKDVNIAGLRLQLVDKENNSYFNNEYTNPVKKSLIAIKTRYEYNEELPVVSNDKLFFAIEITNLTNRKLSNLDVECNLPDELDYDIDHFEDTIIGDYKDNFDSISKDKQKLSWRINELDIGKTKTIYVRTITKDIDENLESKDISIVSKCTVENENYVSNELVKTIYQNKTNLDVKVNTNVEDNAVLKDGDEISYNLTIKNNGVVNITNLSFTLNLDKGFQIKEFIVKDEKGNTINTGSFKDILTGIEIERGETKVIQYVIKFNLKDYDGKNDEVKNKVYITTGYSEDFTIEKTYKVKKDDDKVDDNIGWVPDVDNEKPKDNDTPNTPDNNNTENKEQIEENKTYTLSGIAWMDENKNGRRDTEEHTVSNIKVKLVDKTTGTYVKNVEGNVITSITGENGEYSFTNIPKGIYIVVFEFDTKQYAITSYQKEGVDEEVNSNAIINEIKIDGNNYKVGVTNDIKLESNVSNINIGFIKNAKFDLSLEKQISKTTVVNAQGTKTTEYENINFAKTDLVAKYMNNTSVIITYKFLITNNGDVTGYVDLLQDNLPSGLVFSSELNKDWYKGNDGKLYTEALSGIAIEPGKTSEIELILTKETTENSTGTFSNSAELAKISNVEAIEEINRDNNKSKADIVISIKTGSPILYIGITLGSIGIIAIGAYLIKKKVINR